MIALASIVGIFLLVYFVGYPVASLCLKKEAKRLSKLYNDTKSSGNGGAGQAVAIQPEMRPKYRIFPPLPKDLQTPFILLAKLSLAALFSFWLAGLMNGAINKNIMCLLIGIVFSDG